MTLEWGHSQGLRSVVWLNRAIKQHALHEAM